MASNFMEVYKLILGSAVGIALFTLGLHIYFTKKPTVISGKFAKLFLAIIFAPSFIYVVYEAVRRDAKGSLPIILILYGLAFLLIKIVGDFIVYNVTEDVLRKSIEENLRAHHFVFEEGTTKGLLAHGKKEKYRSIVTINIRQTNSSIRYVFNQILGVGTIQLVNKSQVQQANSVLNGIQANIKEQTVDLRFLFLRYFAAAGFMLFLAIWQFKQ